MSVEQTDRKSGSSALVDVRIVDCDIHTAPKSPEEFATHVQREVVLNTALAQKAGLKAE